MMKIAILGTGSWGSAIAQVLADNSNEVIMYGIEKSEIDDINAGYNKKYFGDLVLAKGISATSDLSFALDGAKLLVIAVPTKFVSSVLESARPYIGKDMLVVNVSKGFDPNTNNRMSDTVRRVIGDIVTTPVVSVIGPSHAEEVILRRLTSLCAVSVDASAARRVQEIFSNNYIRLYVNTDEIGAEYGSAMKNVIALASGMLVGQGFGDNAKAALVTRGLAEMTRYTLAKGGDAKTLMGLTGVGDLVVTCFSEHSRNYQAGLYIGKENGTKEFFEKNQKTVEGIYSCKVVYEDLANYDFEMPITSELYKILYKNKRPSDALGDIMSRPLKDEN
ncbi:MAG: NAD(P)-dependent glycerol-3-phosphate dehydrogenase [Ruminococcaceae bacterium]|nr:NAD(P)-dependent glycerol-3-phosphate dehydrogenase [Oscillospiraceae bacterium]